MGERVKGQQEIKKVDMLYHKDDFQIFFFMYVILCVVALPLMATVCRRVLGGTELT